MQTSLTIHINSRKTSNRALDTLWKLFGDIINENISNNLKNTKICECCKERFEINKYNSKKVLCDLCYEEKRRNDIKINVQNYRNKT